MKKSETLTSRVILEKDGKYHWVYEMNLYRNPAIFFTVWKILFFIFLAIFSVVLISDIHWGMSAIIKDLKFFGYFLVGMTAISALGYLIYSLIMGGKYVVEFCMDENGVTHKQIDWQAIRAQKLGKATALSGIATGRFTTAGVGMNAQRTEMYSDFKKVKKVKAYPRKNLIKVNESLSHNQVYVVSEDFKAVKDYIISHCQNLK